jgi:hypothetical protein
MPPSYKEGGLWKSSRPVLCCLCDDPWEKGAKAVNDRVKSIGAIVRRTA